MGMMKAIGFVVAVFAVSSCTSDEATPDPVEDLAESTQLLADCTVSLQCTTAPTISCSGTNSQCSVGATSVTCNGVTTNCLPPSSACTWSGVTYIHGTSFTGGQCSSRIDGTCRNGPFIHQPCEAPLHCSPKCQMGNWVPRF